MRYSPHPRLPSDPGMHCLGNFCARTAQQPAFHPRGSAALHPWLQTGRRYAAKPRHLQAYTSGRPHRAAPAPHSFPHFPSSHLPGRPRRPHHPRHLPVISPSFRPMPACLALSAFTRGRRNNRHSIPGVPLRSTPGYK